MKVIQVVPSYFPYLGGLEIHVRLLSEALAKDGVEVTVYTTDPKKACKKEEIINGVKIKRFPAFAPNGVYYFSSELFRALSKAKADIIHAHSIHDLPLFFAAVAKNYNKIPLASSFIYHGHASAFFRNMLFQPYKYLFGRYVSKKTDLLICVSEYEKEMIQSDFNPDTRILVIPACLKIPLAHMKTKKSTSDGTKKILFVGRLVKYKGVQYLLEAFKKLTEEMDAQLTISGWGPYEKELRRQTERLRLGKKVFFSRKKSEEIIDEYLASHLVVTPSMSESFNLVAIEALACGTPVITTPIGEAYTLVKEGLCIKLSDPQNIDEFYEKLKVAIQNCYDRQRYLKISEKIREKYSPQRIAKRINSAYMTLA